MYQVSNIGTMWNHVRDIVVPGMYLRQLINGEVVSAYDEQFIDDMLGYRLGQPRLRQLRVRKGMTFGMNYACGSLFVPRCYCCGLDQSSCYLITFTLSHILQGYFSASEATPTKMYGWRGRIHQELFWINLNKGIQDLCKHHGDVIMGTIASQITSLTIVYSTVYSDDDQRKHQSSASLAFVWGIHRGPVNSPHKWPVTRKMFPFDDVIMFCSHLHACVTFICYYWPLINLH